MEQPTQTPEQKPSKARKIKFIILGAAIILFIFSAAWFIRMVIVQWPAAKDIVERQKLGQERKDAMTKEWQDDTMGGSTPEEVYQLFGDALKKKDIELAIQYVHIPERPHARRFFTQELTADKWDEYISTNFLPVEKMKVDDKTAEEGYLYFRYMEYIPRRTVLIDGYEREVGGADVASYFRFQKSPLTDKWKISAFPNL
jgi:hypothetical protein